jgi:squalene-hopene/tetraprenyl-beta-curcumene cyclase
LGLLASGDADSEAVQRGIGWLCSRQREDGGWDEATGTGFARQSRYTATGFPKVFYLAYHLYRQYFPLLALSKYRRATERAAPSGARAYT